MDKTQTLVIKPLLWLPRGSRIAYHLILELPSPYILIIIEDTFGFSWFFDREYRSRGPKNYFHYVQAAS